MFERITGLIHSAVHLISGEAAHLVRSGGDVMRDAVAFDKAGSVLVAVVVVACMFIMPRS